MRRDPAGAGARAHLREAEIDELRLQPAAVSREQIGVFSKLYQMNARPIQSASGRLIKEGQ